MLDAVERRVRGLVGAHKNVYVKRAGRTVIVSLSYETPAHPKHTLHCAGVIVKSLENLDRDMERLKAKCARLGLAPDGSNAATWTGAPTPPPTDAT